MNDIAETIKERGGKYGPPELHFPCTVSMFALWSNRRGKDGVLALTGAHESVLWHAVYMICDKLARAAQSPDHEDNWRDIQGYAECARKVLCKPPAPPPDETGYICSFCAEARGWQWPDDRQAERHTGVCPVCNRSLALYADADWIKPPDAAAKNGKGETA